MIQRNLGYATTDVRVCYRIIKEKLYNPQYSKVIFILHSQGAIEGSLILDWLLQELPQDLLAKLEVYTFGNAANHFNNPHRHIHSQDVALNNPIAASIDSTNAAQEAASAVPQPSSDSTEPAAEQVVAETEARQPDPSAFSLLRAETSSLSPSKVSDRAIGHIEHYAHTTDFVALWGVLHFTTSALGSHSLPRFIGRVFARTSARGGHQFCQHYLDGMFPLERDPSDPRKFLGCVEENNEFMESEIVIGAEGDEMGSVREAMEVSWLGRGTVTAGDVAIHGGSPVEERGRHRRREETRVKVKDLSRLWQYRNGRSPDETPPLLGRHGDGVVRTATL